MPLIYSEVLVDPDFVRVDKLGFLDSTEKKWLEENI
jgi:hypothetical protein